VSRRNASYSPLTISLQIAIAIVRHCGASWPGNKFPQETNSLPKYVIEREIPDAGKFSPDTLKAISQKSCGVLNELGPQIQWVQSYVTDDKIYCIYIAPDEATVRQHAEMGGFPANKVSQVRSIIDPTTGE
jgi:hypothetical protein